jgi:hypothetical protein
LPLSFHTVVIVIDRGEESITGDSSLFFDFMKVYSRVPVPLLNPVGKILIFCGSFGGDREFRDGTEIRGNREKIDREVGKTSGAAEFRSELGLTKG